MRSSFSLVALAIAISGVVASPAESLSIGLVAKFDLSSGTKYNALTPPWEKNCHAGWYYGSGKPAVESSQYPCIGPGAPTCSYLKTRPDQLQCPPSNTPPSGGYTETFSGLSGATQADDYLTYGLVDTVADCEAMCNSVKGCKFVNTYYDVNGKDGSTQLTCSLFSLCHTDSDADNRGGQTQPNGSVDYIADSAGWCRY